MNAVRVVSHACKFVLATTWMLILSIPCEVASAPETGLVEIPSGEMADALVALSAQTGLQVIFPSDLVTGVRAVGFAERCSPAEALERLLQDTPLAAVRSPAGGGFAIITRSMPLADPTSDPAPPSAPSQPDTPMPMNATSPTEPRAAARGLLASLLALFVASETVAQTAPTSQPAAREEPVELSPFLVTAEENDGYRATTTLAGTRIRTELGDVGAAISVMTKELMTDLGVTDATSALSYMLNTEVMGDQGNMGFAPSGSTNGVVATPWLEQRVRGLEPAELSRGLFRTTIPFDSYNAGSVTISRGANSLLFGSGSAGGVIDNSIDVASTSKDNTEVVMRVGHRGSTRFSINHNESIVEGRLGVRLAGLREDTVYKQKPTYQDQTRFYVALTGVLREHREGVLGRTTLRASAEDVAMESWRPVVRPPGSLFATWLELPDPAFDGVFGVNYPTYMRDGTWVPQYTVNNLARPSTGSIRGPVEQPFSRNFALVMNNADVSAYGSYFPGAAGVDGFQGNVNGVTFWGTGEFRPGLNFNSSVELPRTAYDSENNRLGGNSGRFNQDWTVWQAALEQSLFNNKGGIEIAFSREESKNDNRVGPTSVNINVDVAQHLVTGEPNPNLGRPYVSLSNPFVRQFGRGEIESARISAFYEWDLRQTRFGSFLGRHVFSGVFATEDQDVMNLQYRPVWMDSPGLDTTAIIGQNLGGGNRTPRLLAYLGPSLLDPSIRTLADVRIPNTRINAPYPVSGSSYVVRYVDPSVSPVVGNNNVREASFTVQDVPFNGNVSGYRSKSLVASWQAHWLKGHVVTILGYREDERRVYDRIPSSVEPRTNPDGSLALPSLRLNPEPSFSSKQDVLTKSVVARLPDRWNPLRKFGRFAAHWAESDNFSPSSVRRNLAGIDIESPAGTTTERGVTFESPERKFSVRFNWFETKSIDATVPNFSVVQNFWPIAVFEPLDRWNSALLAGTPFATAYDNALRGLTQANAVADNASDFGYTSYQQIMDAYRSVMPAEVQQRFELRYEGNEWVRETINTNMRDIQDRVARGFEIDMGGNLTKNWRVMLNVAKQETIGTNSMPLAYPEALRLNQEFKDKGLYYLFSPTNSQQFRQRWEGQVQNGVVATRVNDGQRSQEQREWRVNLVTNYAFQSDGWLRGVSVGGAVRWQSESALGYPIRQENILGNLVWVPVLEGAFYGPEETNIDVWAKYQRRLSKFDWHVQLNVRNAFSDGDRIPIMANPAGGFDVSRHANPVEVYLTNTFKF